MLNDTMFWQPRVKAMFGISRRRCRWRMTDFYGGVHPEDRERVRGRPLPPPRDPRQGALYDVRIPHRAARRMASCAGWPPRAADLRCQRAAACAVIGAAIDISGPQGGAKQALREADRRKDEFLATLAHELRNPLAPIRNAVCRSCAARRGRRRARSARARHDGAPGRRTWCGWSTTCWTSRASASGKLELRKRAGGAGARCVADARGDEPAADRERRPRS